ncbi:hypothetical protein H4R24_002638 [Coemansia sp. RSA 988]|nr:hypothetical protein H4R24_002638 [Coemansia sp. RSA 988]
MPGNGTDANSSTSAALGTGLSHVSSFSASAADNVHASTLHQPFGDIKALGLGLDATSNHGVNLMDTLASTNARQSNNDVLYMSNVSGNLSQDWLQSIMAQTDPSRQSEQLNTRKPETDIVTSSSGNSDDISRTLSFFLSQQLSQGNQCQQAQLQTGNGNVMQSQFQGIDISKNADVINMRSQKNDYNPSLTDMLEIGYDNGGRRVISMPNPLGNLSFELPINLPVQSSAMSMPLTGQGYPAKGAFGFETAAPVKAPQTQSVLLGENKSQSSLAPTHLKQPSSTALFGANSSTVGLPGLCSKPSVGRVAAISSSNSFSAMYEVDSAAAGSNDLEFSRSSSPEKPISQQLSPQLSTAIAQRTRRRRKPIPVRPIGGRLAGEKAHTAAPSPAIMEDACNGSSSMSTPLLSSNSQGEGMPLPISHRVDRQLAAAGARPLLFVRPSAKGSQSRRRKRRCVSSTDEGIQHVEGIDALDTSSLDGKSVGDLQNTQWQRISEQRRRDAMRENFDLLKRMMPQEYMDSDDGRELARPVLLSRFLRWVDDTLIEMENLKAEVARLQLVASGTTVNPPSNSVWPCPVPWSRPSVESLPLSPVPQLHLPAGSIG